MAAFIGLLMLLTVFTVLVLAGVALLLPVASEAVERARGEREAQVASWQIHRQATQAFGQMLDATREATDEQGRRS